MNLSLTIIVPVYNVAVYLRKCLDSILAQTINDWEAICVDDGSTDGSGAILDEYAARDNRFRVFHKANEGVCAARQVGLNMAEGRYVGAVDADDWVDPDYFERMVSDAELGKSDVVFGGYTREHEEAGVNEIDWQEFPVDYKSQIILLLEGRLWGSVWTRIFRTSFLRKHSISFPHKWILTREDLCFVVETLSKAPKISYVKGVGYHYRIRSNTVSRRQLTEKDFLSHLEVEKCMSSYLKFDWARDVLLHSRQKVMAVFYLEPLVRDKVFFAYCEKSLSGSSVPLHHKALYWLAMRGWRRLLISLVGSIRKVRNGRWSRA